MTKSTSASASAPKHQRPLEVRTFEQAWLANEPYFGVRARGERCEFVTPMREFEPDQGIIAYVAYPPDWRWPK